MTRSVAMVVRQCKSVLAQHYGDRFAGVVLYGSVARGRAQADSDIDLLILLRGPFNTFEELQRIVDLLYPVQLECERLISAKPVPLEDFERGSIQLYRNAKREGIWV
ncbi:MAG: nucleotidyltransferase domain-containing protein [Armatimonadota bacterium]|nr:nucleotidyltransferase domain-containing protein [Armatimonadota bacterium]